MAYTEQKEIIFEMIQSKLGEIEIIDDETASQNFKDSLAIGHTSEDNVCAKIRKKYPKAHVIQGYFKGYDIYVPETGKKVEVKQDKKSNFTGNIVVEIEFNGKPSALSTTKADYWVFDDGETYMWITPVKFVGNGDNKEKLAYLVKKDVIINNCLKVDKYV